VQHQDAWRKPRRLPREKTQRPIRWPQNACGRESSSHLCLSMSPTCAGLSGCVVTCAHKAPASLSTIVAPTRSPFPWLLAGALARCVIRPHAAAF